MLPNSRSTESQDKEVAIRLLSQKLQVELNRLFHELRDGIDMEFIAQRKIQVIFFFLIGVWGGRAGCVCPAVMRPLYNVDKNV